MVEYEFYTVLFGVSGRWVCWPVFAGTALGFPLERPKSVTTELVKDWLKGKGDMGIKGGYGQNLAILHN